MAAGADQGAKKASSAKRAKTTGAQKSGGAGKPAQAAKAERFSDWLVCPQCKGELDESPQRLRCEKCGVDYPIEDGIPVMLPPAPPEAPQPAQEGAGG